MYLLLTCILLRLLKSTLDKSIKTKFIAYSFSRLLLTIVVGVVFISKKRKTLIGYYKYSYHVLDNV